MPRNAVMVGKLAGAILLAACLWFHTPAVHSQPEGPAQCCSLVRAALKAREALHVGDTEAKLEQTFMRAGGMSGPDNALFLYKRCPNIVMRVTFRTPAPNLPWDEPNDRITSMSRLYIDDYSPTMD